MNSPALLIFETHPIQYRAPVYQALDKWCPGQFEVVYASDFSLRGYRDAGFGAQFAWDIPLLQGYTHHILGNDAPGGINRWSGLTGRGVSEYIEARRPRAILLHSFGYAFCWAVYWAALRYRIPLWIRMETQDEAVPRSYAKGLVRSLCYYLAYLGVRRAFFIGQLNREHLLRHGLHSRQLAPARYCTPNPLAGHTLAQKQGQREDLRREWGIPLHHHVVAFFGKLISKKDPELLFNALRGMATLPAAGMTVLLVGSGELEPSLRNMASTLEMERGIRTVFAGFINQSKLPAYYLASDTVVLPSRRAGETWGLVVNEALQAGCGVVVSEAVGCHRDFGDWERFRVVPVGGSSELAAAVMELAKYPRDFDWAVHGLASYTVEAAAQSILGAMQIPAEP